MNELSAKVGVSEVVLEGVSSEKLPITLNIKFINLNVKFNVDVSSKKCYAISVDSLIFIQNSTHNQYWSDCRVPNDSV